MHVTWMITTFVLIDTAIINIDHLTDVRVGVPESKVITVALVATKCFANNHRIALMSCNNFSTYQDQSAYTIESPIVCSRRLDVVFA